MFENNSHTQYVAAEYSAYDNSAKSYDFDRSSITYENHQNSIVESYHLDANSVSYETRLIEDSPEYFKDDSSPTSIIYESRFASTISSSSIFFYSINAMYDEGFAENKRSRVKDASVSVPVSVPVSAQNLSSVLMMLSEIANLLNPNTAEPSQSISLYFNSSTLPQQTVAKSKKKEIKRVEKKIEPQPLIEMFNLMTNVYDKSVSIRQLLKKNKIDLN